MAKKKPAATRAKVAAASVQRNLAAAPLPSRVFASQIATVEVPEDDIYALKLDFRAEDIDFDIVESGFQAVAIEQWDATPRNRRDRRAEQRFNRNRGIRRHSATRAFNRYLAEGGDAGNVQGFLEWLIANWESILKMIMSVIGLFGGL